MTFMSSAQRHCYNDLTQYKKSLTSSNKCLGSFSFRNMKMQKDQRSLWTNAGQSLLNWGHFEKWA